MWSGTESAVSRSTTPASMAAATVTTLNTDPAW
jgi:hypothetical protein